MYISLFKLIKFVKIIKIVLRRSLVGLNLGRLYPKELWIIILLIKLLKCSIMR